MNTILLAALLYKATFLRPPSTMDILDAIYVSAGFAPSDCGVTDWDLHARPEEAECSSGRGWVHFDLDPEAFKSPW